MDLTLFDTSELVALAQFDIENQRLDYALAKVKHAMEHTESSPELYAIAAKLYAQLGLKSKAETLFKTFLETSPSSVNEYFQLGMVVFEQNRIAEAITIWGEVLQLSPLHPPSLFYYGLAQRSLGNLEGAEESWRSVMANIPVSNLYYEKAREALLQLENQAQVQPLIQGAH